jgi:chemotaxis protein MotC
MIRTGLAGLIVFGAAIPAAADTDVSIGLEPYQIVRSLERVQDRLAGGDHASQPMQRKLLEMIDARFATREGSRFENELNRRALLVYAMSGGNPVTVESALAWLGKDDPNRKLGESILFYVNGKPKEALDAFASVDPMAYTPDIAMYLALVKGSMLSEAEPGNALAQLDRARLLGPGTLVEEAALRRSIAVATTLGDAKRFLRLSEQYVRTYLHSPYASQFADAFVAGVVTLDATLDRKAIADIAALMEPEQEKVIYLRIARRAAIDGLIDLAAFAATHAEGLEDDPRAELYSSLSSLTSGTVDDVLDRLSGIDRSRLSESDRQLLDAASAITKEMTAAPARKAGEAKTGPAKIRNVGSEPPVTAKPTDAPSAKQETTPSEATPSESVPHATEQSTATPVAAHGDAAGERVDATVGQAEAMVAATRAKLQDIDRLLGDMPE